MARAPDSARPYILHDQEKAGEFMRRRARLWPIADTPAGGINVAASDMARYMRLYLDDGKVDGAPLVSSARESVTADPFTDTLALIRSPGLMFTSSVTGAAGTSSYQA